MSHLPSRSSLIVRTCYVQKLSGGSGKETVVLAGNRCRQPGKAIGRCVGQRGKGGLFKVNHNNNSGLRRDVTSPEPKFIMHAMYNRKKDKERDGQEVKGGEGKVIVVSGWMICGSMVIVKAWSGWKKGRSIKNSVQGVLGR